MNSLSSVAFVVAAALGIAAYWVPKLSGPAIAALAMAFLLAGR